MTRQAAVAGVLAVPFLACAGFAATAADLKPLSLATGWLGGHASAASLRGRVVLLDVFTFECVNCVNVTPNLKRLYAAYARTDLEIVAVHTPEVPSYQSRLAYLARESREAGLPWPIAIDNGSAIWNAYGVSAWPTQLLFDRRGRLRTTIVGDGQDDEVAAAAGALVRQR
jgi:thiol-disulfide isomerase/thioredoxin